MKYRVKFPDAVREILSNLPPTTKQEMKEGFRFLSRDPYDGEPLKQQLAGKWKLRVGRYRIIYHIESAHRIIRILAIGHRRNIYERFR